jgi:glycosyltransferase involved in cell wall biosynthesis
MRLAITGFVSEQAGSVASANALLLRALLDRGCEIHFFSKASFVDPRPAVGSHPAFQFSDVDNRLADRTRALLARVPVAGMLSGIVDSSTYNKLLVQRIAEAHRTSPFDLCLWLGDYARESIPGLPTVSFAQGPPGTDARSLISRYDEVAEMAGPRAAQKWRLMAKLRLSKFGLPKLSQSDHIIIGSTQSRSVLANLYGVPAEKIHILPYPIDLGLFHTPQTPPAEHHGLHCLWLGRVIPRKRLDLFLNGAALAIQRGVDLKLTMIGGVGFVPGYERMAAKFPFPDRLNWERFVPREKIPEAMHAHDILCQPSDEENFGSSVAEAQACGLPVIVGATNGNADYLCSRDIHLPDDRPESLADAFSEMALRKNTGTMGAASVSRRCAEAHFALAHVADKLQGILENAARP